MPALSIAVCYLRNLFPEDCFKPTSFGNTTIRALIPREMGPDGKASGKVINEDAARLSAWEEAAFEALDLGYLRCIVFGIYSAEDNPAERTLLESYVYHFKYPAGEESESTSNRCGMATAVGQRRSKQRCEYPQCT